MVSALLPDMDGAVVLGTDRGAVLARRIRIKLSVQPDHHCDSRDNDQKHFQPCLEAATRTVINMRCHSSSSGWWHLTILLGKEYIERV